MSLSSYLLNTKAGKKAVKAAVSQLGLSSLMYSNSFTVNGVAAWRDMSKLIYLLKCYLENNIVQAVINIKADAMSNMKFFIKDLKDGELVPIEDYDVDGGVLKELLFKPNPLQSTNEWLKQFEVNRNVFGNAYSLFSIPEGYSPSNFDYKDIISINNLPPYCVSPRLTGKWLSATTKDEIIKDYEFTGFNLKKDYYNPNQILHSNEVSIEFNEHFTEGASKLIALQKPITNIDLAYESRNVSIKKRGAGGILSSGATDGGGSIPIGDTEKKEFQKEYEEYGGLNNQNPIIITRQPLQYQAITHKVKELMLFEEIESNAVAIANSFGVPETLIRYYLKKGSLGSENNQDEKRLYDMTVIPQSRDLIQGLNNILDLKKYGIELVGSFEHINVLQEDEKLKSETKNKNEQTALSAFKIGAIIYDDYLSAIGLPNDPIIGLKRIWDLDENQLRILGIMPNTDNNGGE